MNPKKRLAGRFLPSRVYARWTGTVRFGLAILPLILFLSGSLVYYLTPDRFQSTTTFEYVGKRPVKEAAALLKTPSIIEPAIKNLDLVKRWEMDTDTAVRVVRKNLTTEVNPASRMVELKITHTQKETARDLAAQLMESLDSYEKSRALADIDARLYDEAMLFRQTEDIAEEKRRELTNAIRIRGPQANELDQLYVDEIKRDLQHTTTRLSDYRARLEEIGHERSTWRSTVVVHARPEISNTPVKKSGDSLGTIIWQSLAWGLGFALAAPYLLELAFPRRRPSPTSAAEEFSDQDYEALGIGAPVEI